MEFEMLGKAQVSRWLRTPLLILPIAFLGALVAPAEESDPGTAEAVVAIPEGSGVLSDYLGCEMSDGQIGTVVPTPADMPRRVAIGTPKNSPNYGGRKQGREAAIGL